MGELATAMITRSPAQQLELARLLDKLLADAKPADELRAE